jgi:excisionase family DNA binding protein
MEERPPLTYSVEEAAKAVGISKSKMYELIRSEGFPTVRVGHRCRVSVKGLEKWVDEQAKKGWYAS